jgi:hypothetical protein
MPQKQTFFFRFGLNSLISYLLGIALTTAFYLAVTIFTANAFRIPVEVSFNGISFPISDYSPLWTGDAIRLIFIAGPAACLIWAFIFLGWFLMLPARQIFLRDLGFWMVFHGFNLAFGGIIAGVLTSSGFAWFAKWIYLNETARFFIALISVFLLGVIGLALARPALQGAPALWFIRDTQRWRFVLARLLFPWLGSVFLLSLLRLPVLPLHDLILLFTPGIMLAAIIAGIQSHRDFELEAQFLDSLEEDEQDMDLRERLYAPPRKYAVYWGCLLIILLGSVFYRIIFSTGIIFG